MTIQRQQFETSGEGTERRAGARERRSGTGDRRVTSDRPAPLAVAVDADARIPGDRHGELDPFATYALGEEILRRELGTLSEGDLKQLLRSYSLGPNDVVARLHDHPTLVEMTVNAVRDRVG